MDSSASPPGISVRVACLLVCLLACLTLAGCAGGMPGRAPGGSAGGLQCAPYAREVTGLKLFGPAAGWWRQSAGQFAHSSLPRPGAVLVLRSTRRLPDGHVSVVRRVVGPREILVEHANWEPGRIDREAPVVDVSPRNDWSLVRVWWRPSRGIGMTRFAAYGFILPQPPGPAL